MKHQHKPTTKQIEFLLKHRPEAVTPTLTKKGASALVNAVIRGWKAKATPIPTNLGTTSDMNEAYAADQHRTAMRLATLRLQGQKS